MADAADQMDTTPTPGVVITTEARGSNVARSWVPARHSTQIIMQDTPEFAGAGPITQHKPRIKPTAAVAIDPAADQKLLPLAQKMSKVPDRFTSKRLRTELAEGLGNTYGVDMARKESMECWLMRVLYYMFNHEKPFQAQLGVMEFLEAHE